MAAGVRLKDSLIEALGEHPHVRGIRGKGLMLGIELDRPALDMRLIGLTNRLLFSVTADTVVRLLPPLIICDEEIDELVVRLVKTINMFFAA